MRLPTRLSIAGCSVKGHVKCVTEHEKYAQGATKPGGYAAQGFSEQADKAQADEVEGERQAHPDSHSQGFWVPWCCVTVLGTAFGALLLEWLLPWARRRGVPGQEAVQVQAVQRGLHLRGDSDDPCDWGQACAPCQGSS